MEKTARRACDKTVVLLMVLLLSLGLVTLLSATYYQRTAGGDPYSAVKKQLIGVGLGAAACAVLGTAAAYCIMRVLDPKLSKGRWEQRIVSVKKPAQKA